MLRHTASCLSGPVSWTRRCWASLTQSPARPNEEGQAKVRTELVERVRREIAEGTYDTPEKLEIALERLLKRLEWE
jgi:hypothetical protein